MSSLAVSPEAFTPAAHGLTEIWSAIRSANVAAAPSTTGVVAAAQDEVSAAIAALFGAHGQQYQSAVGRAAAFHDQFVSLLNASAGSYASAEAANTSPFTGAGAHATVPSLGATLEKDATIVEQDVNQEVNVVDQDINSAGTPILGYFVTGREPISYTLVW